MKGKWLVPALGLGLVACGFAQNPAEVFPKDLTGSLTTAASVQIWQTESAENPVVSQLSFPFTLSTPVGKSFLLTVSHSPAFTKWYGDHKLNGLSDTWVQGTYLLPNRRVMFNAGAGLPTGKTRLNNEEFDLSMLLTRNVFRYRVPVYGQGFCGRLGGAAAIQIGDKAVAGIGGQLLFRGPYHPVAYEYAYDGFTRAVDVEYRPGSEATAQAGLDLLLAEQFKLMVDLEHTVYQRDRMDGKEVFGAGTRSMAGVGLYREFGQQYLFAMLTYRVKGKHEYLQGLTVQESVRNLEGYEMDINLEYKAYSFREGGLLILGDGRIYGRNENDVAGATAVGGGIGLLFPMGESAFGDFRIKFLTGKLSDRKDLGILGMDAGFGVRFVL